MPSFFGKRNKDQQQDKGSVVPKVDEELLSRLPVSWPSVDDVAQRLTRVYVKYEPDRLAFVDNNAAKFAPQQPAFLIARLSEVLQLPHDAVVEVLAAGGPTHTEQDRSTTPPPPAASSSVPAAQPTSSDALGRTTNHRGNPWMSAEKAHETFRERVVRQRKEAEAAERHRRDEEARALERATGGFYTADGAVRGDQDCDLCGYHAAANSGQQRPKKAPRVRHPAGDRRNLLGDAEEARRALVAKAAHPPWGDATAARDDHATQRQRALSTTSSVVPVTFWSRGNADARSEKTATPQPASTVPTRTTTPAPAPVAEEPKPDRPTHARHHHRHHQLPGYRVSGCPFSVPTAASLASRSRERSNSVRDGAADASGLVASRAPSPEADTDSDDGDGGWITMAESAGRPLPVGLVIRVLSSAESSPSPARHGDRSASMLEPAPVHRIPESRGRSRSGSMQRWWSPELAALEEEEVSARAALYAVCAVRRDALDEQIETGAKHQHHSPPRLLRSHYHPGGGSASHHHRQSQHSAAVGAESEAFSPVLPVIPASGDGAAAAAEGKINTSSSFANTLGSFFAASPSMGRPEASPSRSGRSGSRKKKSHRHDETVSRAHHPSRLEPESSGATAHRAGSFSGTQHPDSDTTMYPSADTDLEASRSFARPPPITAPPPGSFASASGARAGAADNDDDGDRAAAATSPPNDVPEHTLRSHASMLSDVKAHAEGAMFSSEGVKPPPSAVHQSGEADAEASVRNTSMTAGMMDESRPLSPRHRKIQRDQLPPELVGANEALKKVRLGGLAESDVGDVMALGDAHWSPLVEKEDAAEHLSAGRAYFSFCCKAGSDLSRDVVRHAAAIANLTHFGDEEKENGVPRIDMSDHSFIDPLRFIVVKATYALPGIDPSKLTAELLSSIEYHEKCQPGSPKIEKKMQLPANTIRFVKSIISFVFSITVQLTVSVITDPAVLDHLVVIDGRRPTHAVLMERTKRDVNKQDSTVKCKSLLLYHAVDGGVVCTNVSVVINRSIPSLVAKIVNSFGSSGAAEVKDTMRLTRKYLLKATGDTRAAAAAPTSTRVRGKGTGAGLFGK